MVLAFILHIAPSEALGLGSSGSSEALPGEFTQVPDPQGFPVNS